MEPMIPTKFDSLTSCSSATGIPLAVLKRAKRAGCPAFRNSRVELKPLLVWIFESDKDSTVNWAERLREFKARREQQLYEKEAGKLVSWEQILSGDAAACSKWNQERIKFEQEWPVRMAGKDVSEVRTILREFTTEVGKILKSLRG